MMMIIITSILKEPIRNSLWQINLTVPKMQLTKDIYQIINHGNPRNLYITLSLLLLLLLLLLPSSFVLLFPFPHHQRSRSSPITLF